MCVCVCVCVWLGNNHSFDTFCLYNSIKILSSFLHIFVM